jgi:hypothetical protein
MIDQKEPMNNFCSMIRNDKTCTREIKFRVAIAVAAIKRRRLFSLVY